VPNCLWIWSRLIKDTTAINLINKELIDYRFIQYITGILLLLFYDTPNMLWLNMSRKACIFQEKQIWAQKLVVYFKKSTSTPLESCNLNYYCIEILTLLSSTMIWLTPNFHFVDSPNNYWYTRMNRN
jgi:hypothetical protein